MEEKTSIFTKPRKWKHHWSRWGTDYFYPKEAGKVIEGLRKKGYELDVDETRGMVVIRKRKPLDRFPLTKGEIKKRLKEEASISKREIYGERGLRLSRLKSLRITPKTPRLRR